MTRTLPALLAALTMIACAGEEAPLELPTPLLQETPFIYPEALWDEGVEGQAVVMLHVSAEGTVDSVYVRTTSGYEAMDAAAVEGAKAMRFTPGRRGPDPVDVWIRLPVRFSKTPPGPGEGGGVGEGGGAGEMRGEGMQP